MSSRAGLQTRHRQPPKDLAQSRKSGMINLQTGQLRHGRPIRMPMHKRFLSIFPGVVAMLFFVPAVCAEIITLPTDWPADASADYRVEWQRRNDPGSSLAAATPDDALRGEVAIQVAGASAESLDLIWRPDVGNRWRPDIASSADVQAAGSLLWRHLHSLPQELTLSAHPRGAVLRLDNAEVLRSQMRDEIHQTLSRLEMDMQCTPEATDVLCARVATAEAAAQFITQVSAPFFNCVGLQLDSDKPRRWRTPFQMQGIESAQDFTAEVLDFDPDAAELRLRLLETRDTSALVKAIDGYAGQMDPEAFAELRRNLLETRYSFETECRIERKTGWPIEVIYTARITSPMGGGSERSHYLRSDQREEVSR
jgi:hypothetical protein